jgi:uncharacterized membrane protein YkvI
MKVAAVAIVALAILIAIIPIFSDCESQGRTLTLENGRQVSMKCHWTARAELALGVPLLAVGGLLAFSRRKETRRNLGIMGAVLGAVVILMPTALIGVCVNPDMPCVGIMKPALILLGVLMVAINLAVVVRSLGQEDEAA